LFLFIFESIGTSELMLIGIVALMFLGPRRMPEMARKLGKLMTEFRGTANEFKETWQKEVDFEEEAKALDLNNLEAEPVPRAKPTPEMPPAAQAPAIKPVDPARLEELKARATATAPPAEEPVPAAIPANDPNDKQNWL
jgi:sec-independent protein translocase protein TatB